MANVKITWKGAELLRKTGKAIDEALEAGAKEAMSTARREVPVLTGELKRSIDDTPVQGKEGDRFVVIEADAENTSGEEYAPYVEFGRRGVRAQPFLRPARDAGFDRVRSEMKKRMKRIRL